MEPESGELNYLTEAMNKIIVSNCRILIEKRPRNTIIILAKLNGDKNTGK